MHSTRDAAADARNGIARQTDEGDPRPALRSPTREPSRPIQVWRAKDAVFATSVLPWRGYGTASLHKILINHCSFPTGAGCALELAPSILPADGLPPGAACSSSSGGLDHAGVGQCSGTDAASPQPWPDEELRAFMNCLTTL
jgi:hypothetical protein